MMLAMVGLAPISQAISGALIKVSPEVLFGGAGVGFLAVAIYTMAIKHVWVLADAGGDDEPGLKPAAA